MISFLALPIPSNPDADFKQHLQNDGHDDLRAERAEAARDGLFGKVEGIAIPPLAAGDKIDGHLGIIKDFIAAVQTRRPPETAGNDNIKSLAMVMGAIASAKSGQCVDIRN